MFYYFYAAPLMFVTIHLASNFLVEYCAQDWYNLIHVAMEYFSGNLFVRLPSKFTSLWYK